MRYEIRHRLTGCVLFSAEAESLCTCVLAACADGVNLSGADLSDADLRGVNLRGTDLRGAYLRGAYLRGVNLSGTDLRGTDLRGADLSGAILRDDPAVLRATGHAPLLVLGPIGSRDDYLQAWRTDHGIYVRTGCFWGTLDRFRAAVVATHGDNTYARHYLAAIALIETRLEDLK